MTQTLLARSSLSQKSSLTSLQSQVDGLVGGFAEQATDWRSLAAMMAGGMTCRVGRVGALAAGTGRIVSVGIGLGAEVTAFEMTNRSLSSLTGESHSNPNLWKWEGQGGIRQGLLSSLVTFGSLKGAGHLAQGENIFVQHLLQDTGMVLGHQVSASFGIIDRPQGTLAEQFLHAEATNLQLGAGMALAHSFAPGIQGLERGLDLSLRGDVGANLVFAQRDGRSQGSPLQNGLQPAMATMGGGIVPTRDLQTGPREIKGPTIIHMSGPENEGGGDQTTVSIVPATRPASPRALQPETIEPNSTPLPPVLDPQAGDTSTALPSPASPEGSEIQTRGPEIMTRTIFKISPDQVVVTIGEGAGITPLGSMRTTRRIAVGEPDAIAHMAEDAGYVRYAGIENGATQWRDRETKNPISLEEIEARWGMPLRAQSGIRTLDRLPLKDRTRQLAIELLREVIPTLPDGSERRNLLVAELEKLEKHPIDSMVADFAGVVPSYMRDSLYEKMGLTFSAIGKTRIGGAHYKNVLKSASDQTRFYLWGATEVLNQLGGRLPDLYPHSRKVGFAFGAAFEGWDALVKLIDTHRRGGNFSGLDTPLPDALISQPPAVLANMLGPQFNYDMLKKNPGALRGIVPPNMDPRVGPNTMGPVYTEVAACASAFYALAAGANALTSRLPGQWRPELMMLGASDAALSPLMTPFIVTAFSDSVPIKTARLKELGLTPAQASMPLNGNASGAVISEAAGNISLTTLPQAIARRQLISAIVAGWGLSLGEGGKEYLMGMDEGSVGATLEAINMGIEGHGMSPRDVRVVQLHGTSTKLNNLAEMISLYKVFGAYGGERARPILNALKGLIGHSMGAASIVDLLNAVATLREQRAPRLFNFSMDQIDGRFADTSKTHLPEDLTPAFRFPTETVQEPIEAVLGISEGFGSRNSAVLLRRFDPTILRHYDWPGEMKATVEDFIAAWPDIVAKYEADQLDLRSGKDGLTRGRLVLDNAYPNPVLK